MPKQTYRTTVTIDEVTQRILDEYNIKPSKALEMGAAILASIAGVVDTKEGMLKGIMFLKELLLLVRINTLLRGTLIQELGELQLKAYQKKYIDKIEPLPNML